MRAAAMVLLAAVAAFAAPQEAPMFQCSTPKGWTSHAAGRGGLRLVGPQGADPLSPLILVQPYGPEDPSFPTAEAFLKAQTEPGIARPKGEKVGPVESVRLQAGPARRVTRWSSQFLPPHSMDSQEVRLREEHVVFETAGRFYVLSLAAPEKSFARHLKAFQKVLNSFRPKS